MSATAQHTAATEVHPHAGRITQLHAIAAWLQSHPDAHVDDIVCDFATKRLQLNSYRVGSREQLADVTRQIGGRWNKNGFENLFYLEQEIAPDADYRLVLLREQVCERVVTGTETRKIVEPDPDLVAALPTVERVETVETVEWRCEPILAEKQAA